MRIDRRLTLLGVMLVILSTVMATQYATTKIGFSYGIVNPSMADIRFVGSDNSSDGIRLIRCASSNDTGLISINFGNFSAWTNKTYTAAFAIVNEEPFAINITDINVTMISPANQPDYLQIWLHSDGDKDITQDSTYAFMWNNGTKIGDDSPTRWILGPGDQNYYTMQSNVSDALTVINPKWDDTAKLYNVTPEIDPAVNGSTTAWNRLVNFSSDYVWVQISLNIPKTVDATSIAQHYGTIWISFEATTHLKQN